MITKLLAVQFRDSLEDAWQAIGLIVHLGVGLCEIIDTNQHPAQFYRVHAQP